MHEESVEVLVTTVATTMDSCPPFARWFDSFPFFPGIRKKQKGPGPGLETPGIGVGAFQASGADSASVAILASSHLGSSHLCRYQSRHVKHGTKENSSAQQRASSQIIDQTQNVVAGARGTIGLRQQQHGYSRANGHG